MYGTDFSADFKTTAIQMNYFSIINIVTLYDINLSTSFTRLLCVHFSFLPPPFHFSLSLSCSLHSFFSLPLGCTDIPLVHLFPLFHYLFTSSLSIQRHFTFSPFRSALFPVSIYLCSIVIQICWQFLVDISVDTSIVHRIKFI